MKKQNVERSYPKGKSDLEFVGKFHEKYARMRWVIEFKYYSNQSMRKEKIDLKIFKAQDDDVKQVQGYADDLHKEYPEVEISQFVIYCFANQDFRVYQVKETALGQAEVVEQSNEEVRFSVV